MVQSTGFKLTVGDGNLTWIDNPGTGSLTPTLLQLAREVILNGIKGIIRMPRFGESRYENYTVS